jgi:hypothetical protein
MGQRSAEWLKREDEKLSIVWKRIYSETPDQAKKIFLLNRDCVINSKVLSVYFCEW